MAKQQPSGQYTAFLDQGSSFEGTLAFDGTVRIDGNFKGDVVRGDSLILGESAHVSGTISVGEAIISGKFSGDVNGTDRIYITASAKVQGKLLAPRVGIEEGAQFEGTIRMGKPEMAVDDGRTDGDVMLDSIAQLSQAK